MPKPFTGVSANGHHHHFTLVDENGVNVFHDPEGPAQLSEIARNFLGGMLEHFGALMCIGNPTVNSYCRMWDTGFWAPIYKNWGWQNRTTTVRVATGGRFEYRGVDSSCNPYLTTAALLQAGLDGVRRKLDPGRRSRATRTSCSSRRRDRAGPESLGEALDALAADELIQAAIPDACTRCSTGTSATSGSATWRRSPTGSATSTSRFCRRGRAGEKTHVRNRRHHLPQRRRRAPASGAT